MTTRILMDICYEISDDWLSNLQGRMQELNANIDVIKQGQIQGRSPRVGIPASPRVPGALNVEPPASVVSEHARDKQPTDDRDKIARVVESKLGGVPSPRQRGAHAIDKRGVPVRAEAKNNAKQHNGKPAKKAEKPKKVPKPVLSGTKQPC